MHPDVREAFEEIDAAMFSGDTFYEAESMQMLEHYIARWQRGLKDVKDVTGVMTINGVTLHPTVKVCIAVHTPEQRIAIWKLLRTLMPEGMRFSDKRKTDTENTVGGYRMKFILNGKKRLSKRQVEQINAHIANRGVYLTIEANHHANFQNVRVFKYM